MYSNGAALFGYDLAVISYVLPATNFLSTVGMGTGPTSPEYNESYIGFIVSSLLLGYVRSALARGQGAYLTVHL